MLLVYNFTLTTVREYYIGYVTERDKYVHLTFLKVLVCHAATPVVLW